MLLFRELYALISYKEFKCEACLFSAHNNDYQYITNGCGFSWLLALSGSWDESSVIRHIYCNLKRYNL